MSDSTIIIGFSFLILLIIFINSVFNRKALIKRKLKKATIKPIAHFKHGEVAKITGRIEAVDPVLHAPLSDRPCCYYYVSVDKKVRSGKSSYWDKIIEESDSCTYVIKQDNYYAYINTHNIKQYVVSDRKYDSGFMDDADHELEAFLKHRGYKSRDFLGFNKTIRCEESILEEGETVAVLGKGEWKQAEEVGLPKDRFERVLVITESYGEQVYLSDDPNTHKNKVSRSFE